MKRLLATTAALSLLVAAGPALAATKAPVHGACKAPAGATLLKPGGKASEATVATPVGVANEGSSDAGSFVLDLSGKPESSSGKITLTLSWANPVSDYDLVVGGTNDAASDNPEIRVVKARHCKAVPVEVSVFLGVPVDELTLAAKGS